MRKFFRMFRFTEGHVTEGDKFLTMYIHLLFYIKFMVVGYLSVMCYLMGIPPLTAAGCVVILAIDIWYYFLMRSRGRMLLSMKNGAWDYGVID